MDHVLGVAFYARLGAQPVMAIKVEESRGTEAVWRTLEARAKRLSIIPN